MTDADLSDLLTHTANPAWLLDRGVFVAEGRYVVRRLLEAGTHDIPLVVLTPPAAEAMADALAAMPADRRPPAKTMTQAEMDRLTGFRLHQGCVAFARRKALAPWTAAATATGVSILLERVRDPDNVGSIIRSAAALGVRTVLIGPECADPFYRKAIRTSMGAVFGLTLVRAEPWPDVLAAMAAAGVRLVATTPDPHAPAIDDIAMASAGATPIVLMIGSEGEGLTTMARTAASVEARIPMASDVDSLNAAVAAAIAVYALTRRTQ